MADPQADDLPALPFSDSVPDAERRGGRREEGGTWKGRAPEVGGGSSIFPKRQGSPENLRSLRECLKGTGPVQQEMEAT